MYQPKHNIQSGTKILFTETGKHFILSKVTEKNVSWETGFTYRSGNGVNLMRMAWTSRKQFEKGIDKGAYKIIC